MNDILTIILMIISLGFYGGCEVYLRRQRNLQAPAIAARNSQAITQMHIRVTQDNHRSFISDADLVRLVSSGYVPETEELRSRARSLGARPDPGLLPPEPPTWESLQNQNQNQNQLLALPAALDHDERTCQCPRCMQNAARHYVNMTSCLISREDTNT